MVEDNTAKQGTSSSTFMAVTKATAAFLLPVIH
jgi:hypothetical protein